MSENNTKRLHNGGAAEVVYDVEGHILAAGETVELESPLQDERTKALVKSGGLVEVKETHKIPARTAKQPDSDAKNGEK